MKKIKKTFGENLEQIEIAKLRLKYEELGFNFYSEKRFPKENLILDAYAKHPISKEEIIFEVKAKESIKKGDTEIFVARRDQLLKRFPKARFVLVLAKKPSNQIIEDSSLNDLIFDFVKHFEWKKNPFSFLIAAEPIRIESISIDKIDFKKFNRILLEGYGNFVFKHFIKDENFEGTILSDGILFQFKISLINRFDKDRPFEIDHNSKFIFDMSEFKK
jgi:hypothetical protein